MENTYSFRLTAEEAKIVKTRFSRIPYDPNGSSEYLLEIRSAAYQAFPQRLLSRLEKLKHDDASFALFENLPIDVVHGSPLNDADSLQYKDGYLSENIIMGFGAVIAEPYSIHFEGQKIVNNLVPHPDTKAEYTGIGSEVELDFHIENAALAYHENGDTSPLGLLLLGVRSDPQIAGPKTYVADAREALKLLSDDEIATLYSNSFIIRQPYRWRKDEDHRSNIKLHPILTGSLDYPRVTVAFYPDMVIPVDHAAKRAYRALYESIRQVSVAIDIQPGMLIYINNRFTLHSRQRFSPSHDENGSPYRWVQRVFLTNNLWNFRDFYRHGDRIYDPSSTREKINSKSHRGQGF
ncbi:TauD/TfdA family dioxygenase [uncultured Pseudomonas sp.]|uniref:TauD/TfdA family dioxygenase n=1 Tax=uncultured Pseudomonas sp. TaxID=114707 RepID=UPI0025F609C4|nr:TauD/TfdA family dioxygenase [uncultured Pseudomonas sp.]